MTRKEFIRKKLLEHLVGPTGSVLLHIVIIYLAVHFIVFETRESTQEIEAMMMEIETVDLDELLEELEPELEPLEFDLDFEMPDYDVDVDQPPDPQDFTQDQPDMEFAALDVMQVESPLTMQGLFSGRNEAGRAALLRRYGGRWGEQTEQAVMRALEWLRINQLENGSWDHHPSGRESAPAAMTGLALLTFLAHGETPSSERYGRTVQRAIRYLSENLDDKGAFKGSGANSSLLNYLDKGQAHSYGHSIAAYAIAEAAAMTRIPALREVMDRSIQRIIDDQHRQGGWYYGDDHARPRDTSVTAFNIQAMKAAQLAGSRARGLPESMDLAMKDIAGSFNADTGRFTYRRVDSGNYAMTAISVLMYQLTGNARAQESRVGLESLRSEATVDWRNADQWSMYRWYYITQVMFQAGGGTWTAWNNQFAPAFVNNQNADGSWTSPSGRREGGSGREVNYGPVYSTAFAALSLQVYYRILPTFAVVEQEEEKEETSTDDVIIQII